MNRKSSALRKRKGAVCTGLFLGVLFMFAGCVKPAGGPEMTSTPEPAVTSGTKPTPEPILPTDTPVPTVTEQVVKPTVIPTAEPTKGPEVTPTGVTVPTEGPKPTPEVTPTPLPQEGEITQGPSPTPGETAEVTPEPTPESTPTPELLPTAVPEYDALLQSGWQRTEDFFGDREIFFSGRFDDAEPTVGQGSYEFSYRAISDVSVLLRIIGEEGMGVQPFVDELRQNRPECLIVQEGPEDYSYTYIEGKTQVSGRIYECRTGEKVNRMRVEFYSPAGSDMQTEGYGFYLR